MKFLLTPLSVAAFFMLSASTIYGLMLLTAYLYSISWLWLLVLYLFTGALALATLKTWLMIGVTAVMYFYDYNLFSRIIHALGLLSGIIFVTNFFILNPPLLIGPNKTEYLFAGMWDAGWFKTIFVMIPMLTSLTFIVMLHIETLTARSKS
jgi:hypothetical protein